MEQRTHRNRITIAIPLRLGLRHLFAGAFLPDGVVVAVGNDLVPRGDERADIVPGTDLHDHLAVDLRQVGIAVVLEDRQLTRRRDAVALPHCR